MMDFQGAIKELQDTLVVVSEIQRRQAEVQKLQAYELDAMREWRQTMRDEMSAHSKRMAHIDQTLHEAGDKLNGLIGYLDGLKRDKPE
jgi:hypothetical protein